MSYTCKTSKKFQKGLTYINSITPDKNLVTYRKNSCFHAHFTDKKSRTFRICVTSPS